MQIAVCGRAGVAALRLEELNYGGLRGFIDMNRAVAARRVGIEECVGWRRVGRRFGVEKVVGEQCSRGHRDGRGLSYANRSGGGLLVVVVAVLLAAQCEEPGKKTLFHGGG